MIVEIPFIYEYIDREMETPPHKAGYVAIVGEPNVGKSTLMNTLLKQKISIVTNKPQTTRHKILGILTGENYQIVFLDTPGIITPRYLLQEVMMHHASSALDEADVVLLLVDAEKIKNEAYQKERNGARKNTRRKEKDVSCDQQNRPGRKSGTSSDDRQIQQSISV